MICILHGIDDRGIEHLIGCLSENLGNRVRLTNGRNKVRDIARGETYLHLVSDLGNPDNIKYFIGNLIERNVKAPLVLVSSGYDYDLQTLVLRSRYRQVMLFLIEEVLREPDLLLGIFRSYAALGEELKNEEVSLRVEDKFKASGEGVKFASLFVPPMREFIIRFRNIIMSLDTGFLVSRKNRPFSIDNKDKWTDKKIDEYYENGGDAPKHIKDQLWMHAGELFSEDRSAKSRKVQCVLITGETGSGKTLLARWLVHLLGSSDNYMEFSCANISPTMLEAELFGKIEGAWTDATTTPGLFLNCYGGCVLLDEVGTMSLEIQARLLKFFEEGEVMPNGWHYDPIPCPCLVILATNSDLENMVEEGTFRKDLYYRIATHKINIPPLKERKNDLELLIDMLLQDEKKNPGREIKKVSKKAMDMLQNYEYPGNFRELEMIVSEAIRGAMMDCVDTILERHIKLNP